MYIHQCDICNKPIDQKVEEKISVSISGPEIYYRTCDLCASCGEPIKNILIMSEFFLKK